MRARRLTRAPAGTGEGYDARVPRIVLTAIGDDRAGLVEALSEIVTAHSGNWERSQMAELAGKFAGIVVVTVPADRVEQLTAALQSLDRLLEVSTHPAAEGPLPSGPTMMIDLLGTDRPGIVREVSAVLNRHRISIDRIDTSTREAPMAGGQLFEAHIVVRLPDDGDPDAMRTDLERLADELLVDIALSER